MNNIALDDLLRYSLREDIGFADITSEAIFSETHVSQGFLLAKQDFTLAGIEVFSRVFALLDNRVKVKPSYMDGTRIKYNEKFALIEGPTRALLTGERVALNFLQHMSGIATKTNQYVEQAQGTGAVIVDTRKTTPGLRMLEKYAVNVGGGKNHRFGLDYMVMIKDNHIQAAGGINAAVQQVRDHISPFIKIEVEVETMDQVRQAVEAGADIIMLDNMPITMIQQAVQIIQGKAFVEVSGNVTVERVSDLAIAGVDIISSGSLTHSVKAIDISMRLQ